MRRKQGFEWTEEANDRLLNLVTTKGHQWKIFEKYFDGVEKSKIKQQYFKLKKEGRLPTGLGKFHSNFMTNIKYREAKTDKTAISSKYIHKRTIDDRNPRSG